MFFFKYIWAVLVTVPPEANLCNINTKLENTIQTSIDYTANPCDDFYTHACGNYAEQHKTKYYQEMTGLMDYQYNLYLLNLMDSSYQHNWQVTHRCQSFVEKARIYLKSCRKETTRNLTRYFKDIKPGPKLNWPILQKLTKPWPEATFDIWTLLGKLQSYGLNNALINQEITVGKNGEFLIKLEPAYSEANSTLADFNILEVLLMGLKVSDAQYVLDNLRKTDEFLLDILEKFQEHNEESREITYGDLEQQYPQLNLHLYLQELLSLELTPNTVILLKNPEYFQYLNDKMWQNLRKAEWCNYLMMKFLYYLAVDSTAEFKSIDCVKDLRNKMDLAVNYLYYQHEYACKAQQYKADVSLIFQNIKNKFDTFLQRNRLNLTTIQVQFLRNKLQNVRLNIGNLPDDITCDKVEKFYENIPVLDKNNYYKNHLHLLKHRFQKSLHYAANQTHFIVTDNRMGSSSGAFYVLQQNMIVLPFGSLVYPLFDANYYDMYKYSLLGFILAHEFTHAFDTSGVNFDSVGELINEEKTSDILYNQNFENSLNCMRSQLPTDSIDERMADINGINIVFDIYNEMNPGGMSALQLKYYYLNLAQFFCGKSNINFIDHDSDAQRLNQIVMNSEGFAYAFQCPQNSKMHPNKKCRLY